MQQTGSVTVSKAEQKVVSNVTGNEYVATGDFHGNSKVTDSSGISEFTPNTYRLTTTMDRFIAVKGDDSVYVRGDREVRVDGGDYYEIIGPATAMKTDAYQRWADEFAKIAAANLTPELKIPTYPIFPGIDINNIA